MQDKDILKRLKSLSNPKAIEGMAKYGITPESAYGVSIPSLRIYFKVKAEEKALIGVFGKEYESYRATTGMFFSRVFKRNHKRYRPLWFSEGASPEINQKCCQLITLSTGL